MSAERDCNGQPLPPKAEVVRLPGAAKRRPQQPGSIKVRRALRAKLPQIPWKGTHYLNNGELSVWRLSDAQDAQGFSDWLEEQHPNPDPNQRLKQLFCTLAGNVRSIVLHGRRACSVINDTRCDLAGKNDPKHATIAPCAQLRDESGAVPDGEIAELINRLDHLFRTDAGAVRVDR